MPWLVARGRGTELLLGYERARTGCAAHAARYEIKPYPGAGDSMRMTIDVDDEPLRAQSSLGISERSVLIWGCGRTPLFVAETGRQLTALGGSDQAAEADPRVASTHESPLITNI